MAHTRTHTNPPPTPHLSNQISTVGGAASLDILAIRIGTFGNVTIKAQFRRRGLKVGKRIAAFIGLALLTAGAAHGQTAKGTYPDRPVRIIVPFAAGGPGGNFARLFGQKLSEQLGQQFVIENRPGAGGNIGTGAVARAPADGYTLLVASSAVWVNAILYPQIPYDPVRDFEPIIIGA